ncbi:MAG TPA: phosphatase PAP2 family protein [Gemmatimonadaceae bacterium]|nr:phosphatase PAP2 family protein [Gemmatimonadaceae bacterium]
MIPVALAAQDPAPSAARREPLITRRDFLAAGGVLAASALLSLWDVDVHRAVQDSGVQGNRTLRNGVKGFNYLQETYLTVGGLAAYGIGRVTKQRAVADIGFHVAEAVFVASTASQLVRGPLGRARPTTNGGTDQYEFHPFKGFREFEYRAFPSIHSSSGFAAATVITREVAERWPAQKGWVGPVAYALAATPGLSRVYLGQHWMSDVVMGAAVGIIAGQRVVTYNHRNPNNRVNRFFLGKSETSDTPLLRIGVERKF